MCGAVGRTKVFLQERWAPLWEAWNQPAHVRHTPLLRCEGRLDHRIYCDTIRDTSLVHNRHQALLSERDGHRGRLLACRCIRSM